MLILSRKVGQRIRIDDRTEVTVLHVRGTRVTLGISAPGHVRIQRTEILEIGAASMAGPQIDREVAKRVL